MRYAIMTAAVFAAALGLVVMQAERAECAYCYNQTCFNSGGCLESCVCFKTGTNPTGNCVSIE